MKHYKPIVGAFLTAAVVMLLGVLFFFKIVAESDTTSATVPPLIGLIVYSGFCTAIYQWAIIEMRNVYKAAIVVALPQFAQTCSRLFPRRFPHTFRIMAMKNREYCK